MRRYFIRTWTFEGSMVYEYGYTQWKEIIANFKSVGRRFEAWAEGVDGNVVERIEYVA